MSSRLEHNLTYHQPEGFAGYPVFGFSNGGSVDRFGNILQWLSEAQVEKLHSILAPEFKEQEGDYSVYFSDATSELYNQDIADLPLQHQEDILSYYNRHASNGRPLKEKDKLNLSEINKFVQWEIDWDIKGDDILPLPMNKRERECFETVLEYASHVDLVMRLEGAIGKTEYNVMTRPWRKFVGALYPDEKDIFVGV